ncbi:uncharacterized protein B0H18DRAFT_1182287 [Fomitopsis serialis]|uniref:uncharacterized protein n=1 Tax=Fomitopsis serialis TaxID=139415 RepID=UPI002007685F|nr:uncharacterized protein B0H18DRAFT_1182287 [Neoantrodia serialis]KAH9934988.1 hypothetical protein B0H18DRAFT_1182287 [Neoantrodia serialis]
MFSILTTVVTLALALAGSQALGQQQVLESSPRVHEKEAANFTQLFASDGIYQKAWTRESWNGLTTFARSAPLRCFGADSESPYDVAVLGAPFDTATSFRPGTFRTQRNPSGWRRLGIERINVPMKIRVSDYLDIVDCGDVPMVTTDNKVALRQLEAANKMVLSKTSFRSFEGTSLAKDGKYLEPRAWGGSPWLPGERSLSRTAVTSDYEVGFVISHADDLEEIGWRGVVKKIRDTVGITQSTHRNSRDRWITTREIKKIMQGLAGLKIVGADIVEVAPGYDTQDEITQIAAANIGYDILALMAKAPLTV